MIEAEELKAHLAAIEEKEAQDQAEKAAIVKNAAEAKKASLIQELKEEPTDGDLINVAFRMPDGTRLVRNFRQDDPIKVKLTDAS